MQRNWSIFHCSQTVWFYRLRSACVHSHADHFLFINKKQ
nr:MAG TPA: hypothetical protein [Caudoviricetes sp.]